MGDEDRMCRRWMIRPQWAGGYYQPRSGTSRSNRIRLSLPSLVLAGGDVVGKCQVQVVTWRGKSSGRQGLKIALSWKRRRVRGRGCVCVSSEMFRGCVERVCCFGVVFEGRGYVEFGLEVDEFRFAGSSAMNVPAMLGRPGGAVHGRRSGSHVMLEGLTQWVLACTHLSRSPHITRLRTCSSGTGGGL